jgi:hypothetical protein
VGVAVVVCRRASSPSGMRGDAVRYNGEWWRLVGCGECGDVGLGELVRYCCCWALGELGLGEAARYLGDSCVCA